MRAILRRADALRQGGASAHDDAVAALALGLVERGVGLLEQRRVLLGAPVTPTPSDAVTSRPSGSAAATASRRRSAISLALGVADAGQQDEELLAAEAVDELALAQRRRAARRRRPDEHRVAALRGRSGR